jgi:hypothetical protein
MIRLGLGFISVLILTACAADVGDAPQSALEVEGTAEAVFACSYPTGPFTFPWADIPTFSNVTNPAGQMSIQLAVGWLQNHSATMNLPTGSGGRLIAWDDPSLSAYVAYLMTDSLWAQHALKPFNATLAAAMKTTLVNAGWWGDGLFDTLFRRIGNVPFKPLDQDVAHGAQIASCTATNGRTAQLRVFNFGFDQSWTDGQSRQFIDSAVYRALDEYWTGGTTRQTGINRINSLIADTRHAENDLMFWDATKRVFVDVSSRADFDNGGNYDNATFKVGLVLYALKVMGISSPFADAMKQRLADAQWGPFLDFLGGLAHVVTYDASGNKVGASGPTGEATSIGILSSTVNHVP